MRSAVAHRTWLATALAITVILAGCTPGSTQRSSGPTEGPVETDPAKMGTVTITEWDIRNLPAQSAAQDKLNAAFEAKYPNIKIKRVVKQFTDYERTIKLALSSPKTPDVMQVNQGYGDLAKFVKAGLLLPQDNYAKAYGWTGRYNAALLDQNRMTADGHWGTGQLYGISNQAEVVGLYYNKTLLSKIGLTPPRTLADLQGDLPKIKAAGMLPIQLGTSDINGAIHIFGLIQAVLAGPAAVNDLVFGKGDASWTDQSTLEAARTLQSWATQGYVTPGANGQNGTAMAAEFGKGHGVFMVDGNWSAPQLATQLGPKVGFTVLSKVDGGKPATEGGLSLLWGISSRSKHPDADAAYLNFINSPAAEDVIARGGDLPAVTPSSFKPVSGLQADVYASLQSVVQEGSLLPYLDYTTINFYAVLGANLQELISGRISPESFTKTLQTEYTTAKASR
jgi:raffinose/stachyose/melibiose transport system substrate-binding protein